MGKPPNQAALKQYAEDKLEVDKKMIDEKTETLKAELEKDKDAKGKRKAEEDYSSGVESDHDVDLLVEQEVL